MGLGERIMSGIETLGRRANQALDEGRVRMDLLKTRRRRDLLARDLGYLVYRQSKGTPPLEGEIEALTKKMADEDVEMARLEEELKRRQQLRSQAGSAPQP
jgi:hypothetical protein